MLMLFFVVIRNKTAALEFAERVVGGASINARMFGDFSNCRRAQREKRKVNRDFFFAESDSVQGGFNIFHKLADAPHFYPKPALCQILTDKKVRKSRLHHLFIFLVIFLVTTFIDGSCLSSILFFSTGFWWGHLLCELTTENQLKIRTRRVEMETKNAVVGFSVNPEVVGVCDSRGKGEKLPLLALSVDLAGAAANVAIALNAFGCFPLILGLTGKNGDETLLLDWAVRKAKIPFKPIEVLDHTSIALLPIDKAAPSSRVLGRKGVVVSEKVSIAVHQIRESVAGVNSWRIAVGVRPSEVELAQGLFFESVPGKRILSPHFSFCEKESRDALFHSLSSVDLFILNQLEYEKLGVGKPKELHRFGPSVVIVTQDERGGYCSFRGESSQFDSVKYSTNGVYPTGAGDWFLGGLLSAFISREVTLETIKRETFLECLHFAAKVAGKKVTIPGGGKGPTSEEL